LAKVIDYFSQHDIAPDHMSSYAGLDYTDGLFHLVVDKFIACVIVVDSPSSPLAVSNAAAVAITGIGCIPNIDPFLCELIGGLAIVYFFSFYLHPIAEDMDTVNR
jgi:hypothetical protein